MTLTSGNCERARAWSSLRADGELSELELALLQAHLERCPGCRAFAQGLDGVESLLRTQPPEAPSRPISVGRTELRRRGSGSLRLLHASAALAVVATGCLAVFVAGIMHVTADEPAVPQLKRVSAVDNESPQPMPDLRRLLLADGAAHIPRHPLNP
jgi:predicted anti-sigma-YlaC factor YlaD